MLDIAKLPNIDADTALKPAVYPYIPIVAHFDDTTLITRNGELVQTFVITADAVEMSNVIEEVRDVISAAVCDAVNTTKISVTTHVVRERRDLTPRDHEDGVFISNLTKAWIKLNNFDKQLVNTVYISFVYQSSYSSIWNLAEGVKSFFFSLLKKRHLERLQENFEKLNAVTNKFLEKTKHVGARRLGLVELEDGLVSEPLMFYHYLSHLDERKTYLPIQDLSKYLGNFDIDFGFNSLQISNESSAKYAAIFSFKDNYILNSEILDKILYLGLQFTITQHHIFTSKNETISKYQEFADIAVLSKTPEMNDMMGYNRILSENKGGVTDYSKLFSYILVYSDDEKFFQDKIKQLTKVLHGEGILAVREDFSMPQLFWAQMPGNHRYLPKDNYICADDTSIAAYASIHHNKSGNFHGSAWGKPVAILRSFTGVPFYFNFHNKENNGSTLIVGPTDSGKSTLARFLLAHSIKYSPRVYYFDFLGESKEFASHLGLKIVDLDDLKDAAKINPFNTSAISSNEQVFTLWLAEALGLYGSSMDQYKEAIAAIASRLLNGADISDKVGAIGAMISSLNDTTISKRFEAFFKDDSKFAKYFIQEGDNFSINALSKRDYFNLKELDMDKQLFHTYFGLFFSHLVEQLDGKEPTIIYINDFLELFKISFIQENFATLLKKLKSKNAILIATMNRDSDLESDRQFLNTISGFGTKLFMSDRYADKYFKRAYGLDEDELHKIKSYATTRRIFLLKQDDISTMITLNLSGLGDLLTTLASKP